jgi:hypothetical protein
LCRNNYLEGSSKFTKTANEFFIAEEIIHITPEERYAITTDLLKEEYVYPFEADYSIKLQNEDDPYKIFGESGSEYFGELYELDHKFMDFVKNEEDTSLLQICIFTETRLTDDTSEVHGFFETENGDVPFVFIFRI